MKIGDVVNLRSGGSYMTVTYVSPDGLISAVWTDDVGTPHEIEYPEECFEPKQVDDTV